MGRVRPVSDRKASSRKKVTHGAAETISRQSPSDCPTTGCETPPSRQNNKLSNYAADRSCDSASSGVRFRFLGSLRRVTQGFVFSSHVELKV